MGINLTHNAWTGSYTAFAAWRTALAGAAGYETTAEPDPETGRISFEELRHAQYAVAGWQFNPDRDIGDWTNEPPPPDPLLILLTHSDCDGRIAPQQAQPLADRLEQLLPRIPQYTKDLADEMQLQFMTRKFVAGLRDAIGQNQPIIFR